MTITSMRFSPATSTRPGRKWFASLVFFCQVFFSQRVYPDLAEEVESSESSESMRSGFAYHNSRHNGPQHSDNTSALSFLLDMYHNSRNRVL